MNLNRPPLRPGTLAVFALAALAALAVFTVGCRSIAAPEGWASPVLDEGDGLLLVSHRDHLIALDAKDLTESWRFPAEGDEIDTVALYGTPALGDGVVFVPTWEGTFYALDKETGAVRWSYEADGELVGDAAFSHGTVYFGCSSGRVYALKGESGDLRWRPFETDDSVWSAPALTKVGDVLYVTSLDGRLYALNAETGEELWSFETDAGIAAGPVVAGDSSTVYVGGFDSRLRAIDTAEHRERWSVQADNWFWAEPLLEDGTLYAASLDGKVRAVDSGTGEPRWPMPFSTAGPIKSAPVMADGLLVVVDKDGNVYAIDPATGGAAVPEGPLALGAEVLADPLVVPNAALGGKEAGSGGEEVVIVTTKGEVVRVDPTTLQRIGSSQDLGG